MKENFIVYRNEWKLCPAGFGELSKGAVMVLYRDVNPELYEQFAGALIPNENKPFIKRAKWGRFEWRNAYWGECEANAVVEHQQHQAGYPTSGMSTTPHLNRAVYYATHDGQYSFGYVYVIDDALCQLHKVAIYKVKDFVPSPSMPEDDEVILVAHDFGVIPRALVIEIRKISV
ncbi:MAG: hypothetical protein WA635_00020 [Gallionella sp.]